MTTPSLLELTPTQLQRIRGANRQQLVGYLKSWGEYASLLRYVEVWLGSQPGLATLRQWRAEALLALGQAATALEELDQIDAERGPSAGRRLLRAEAIAALGQWDRAHAALSAVESDDKGAAREHGDLYAAQGDFEQAARMYRQAGIDVEGSVEPTLCAARFAHAQGDSAKALSILRDRYAQADYRPRLAELQLECTLVAALGDQEAVQRLEAEIARRETEQRQLVLRVLGLDLGAPGTDVGAPGTDVGAPGTDAPTLAPVMPVEVLTLLQEQWGYADLRGRQAAVIARVLAGQPTLAVLPTGAGKSLCYQLPAFLHAGATIVVSPLIALMKDQLDGLPPALRKEATAINSSLRSDEVVERLQGVRDGRYKLVYIAPERLRQQAFVHALRQAGIARFVVDEAHCVSLWGLSFRPDYLFLKQVLAELHHPPVLALTATATPETQQEIKANLGDLSVITASVFRANLHFSVLPAGNSAAKEQSLLAICRQSAGAVVVYARARSKCEELADMLRRNGIAATHYHAQVPDRAAIQEQWMRGEVRVLVATIAFGMGVDKADVRMIVHYNLPQSVEAYYQEAGRAGRDGEPAQCVLLYSPGDKGQLMSWLKEEAIDKDDLRAVYRSLRGHAQHGHVAIHSELLLRDLPTLDETRLRVVLGMLERVGLLLRHYDLPRTMHLTLLGAPPDRDWELFAAVVYPRVGQRITFDPISVAAACGWRPHELEARLLRWQTDGTIRYNGTATDLLLELLPAPPDTAERIDRLLVEYSDRQAARVAAMVAYAKGLNCRHRALAAHFGERLAACGGSCDVCKGTMLAPEPLPLRQTQQHAPGRAPLHGPAVAQAILHTVRDLPFSVGRTGLANILVGSSQSSIGADRCPDWGALSGYTHKAALAMIDDLVDAGYLLRIEDNFRPLLALSRHGSVALQTPDTLPDLAPLVQAGDRWSDDELYHKLDSWRRQVAQTHDIPAYYVFGNATLRNIAAARPHTLQALSTVKGVGPTKLEQWGAELLALIREF